MKNAENGQQHKEHNDGVEVRTQREQFLTQMKITKYYEDYRDYQAKYQTCANGNERRCNWRRLDCNCTLNRGWHIIWW